MGARGCTPTRTPHLDDCTAPNGTELTCVNLDGARHHCALKAFTCPARATRPRGRRLTEDDDEVGPPPSKVPRLGNAVAASLLHEDPDLEHALFACFQPPEANYDADSESDGSVGASAGETEDEDPMLGAALEGLATEAPQTGTFVTAQGTASVTTYNGAAATSSSSSSELEASITLSAVANLATQIGLSTPINLTVDAGHPDAGLTVAPDGTWHIGSNRAANRRSYHLARSLQRLGRAFPQLAPQTVRRLAFLDYARAHPSESRARLAPDLVPEDAADPDLYPTFLAATLLEPLDVDFTPSEWDAYLHTMAEELAHAPAHLSFANQVGRIGDSIKHALRLSGALRDRGVLNRAFDRLDEGVMLQIGDGHLPPEPGSDSDSDVDPGSDGELRR